MALDDGQAVFDDCFPPLTSGGEEPVFTDISANERRRGFEFSDFTAADTQALQEAWTTFNDAVHSMEPAPRYLKAAAKAEKRGGGRPERVPADGQKYRPLQEQAAEWASFHPHLRVEGSAYTGQQQEMGFGQHLSGKAPVQGDADSLGGPDEELSISGTALRVAGRAAWRAPPLSGGAAPHHPADGACSKDSGMLVHEADSSAAEDQQDGEEEEVFAQHGVVEEVLAQQGDAADADVPALAARSGPSYDERAAEVGLPVLEPEASLREQVFGLLVDDVWAAAAPGLAAAVQLHLQRRRGGAATPNTGGGESAQAAAMRSAADEWLEGFRAAGEDGETGDEGRGVCHGATHAARSGSGELPEHVQRQWVPEHAPEATDAGGRWHRQASGGARSECSSSSADSSGGANSSDGRMAAHDMPPAPEEMQTLASHSPDYRFTTPRHLAVVPSPSSPRLSQLQPERLPVRSLSVPASRQQFGRPPPIPLQLSPPHSTSLGPAHLQAPGPSQRPTHAKAQQQHARPQHDACPACGVAFVVDDTFQHHAFLHGRPLLPRMDATPGSVTPQEHSWQLQLQQELDGSLARQPSRHLGRSSSSPRGRVITGSVLRRSLSLDRARPGLAMQDRHAPSPPLPQQLELRLRQRGGGGGGGAAAPSEDRQKPGVSLPQLDKHRRDVLRHLPVRQTQPWGIHAGTLDPYADDRQAATLLLTAVGQGHRGGFSLDAGTVQADMRRLPSRGSGGVQRTASSGMQHGRRSVDGVTPPLLPALPSLPASEARGRPATGLALSLAPSGTTPAVASAAQSGR